jgi:23S rRNA pseudouridine1911/1915/1917 synthase
MQQEGQIVVEAAITGRLDAFMAEAVTEVSRSHWKTLIQKGRVTVNGAAVKPNHRLHPGEEIRWTLPDEPASEPQPEEIPLDILFEDDALLMINKPPGLVVHPAAGNDSGTLVNALLFHDAAFRRIERAGIVHRLDKDTSGVMVIAKSDEFVESLKRQFKDRTTEKEYLALVRGHPPPSGRIENRIGRHHLHRKKMAVLKEGGREAVTNYKVMEQFADTALLAIRIETGRTHQIRVHMAHAGHPVVGDAVYGGKGKKPLMPERQMLHAAKLVLTHPVTGKRLSFEAPLPDDMLRLLELLRNK